MHICIGLENFYISFINLTKIKIGATSSSFLLISGPVAKVRVRGHFLFRDFSKLTLETQKVGRGIQSFQLILASRPAN